MMRRVCWAAMLLLMWSCDDEPAGPQIITPPDGGVDGAIDAQPDADRPPVDMAPPRPDRAVPDAHVVDALPPDQGVDASNPIALCDNGRDDDGDGAADYPADPGCESPLDNDETDPALPACRNGVDDDGDGQVDHPADPGCASPDDPSEASACAGHVVRDISALRRVEGTTAGEPASLEACRANMSPEGVFLFTLRDPVETLHFDTAGSSFDTLLQVRRVCDDAASEVACNDDVEPGERTSAVDIDRPALGDYYVVVDGFLGGQGDFVLNIRAAVRDGQACPEGEGPVQCRLGAICFEGECAAARCANRRDDDRDGRIDFPNDPGCVALDDDDETDPEVAPQCADGVDNDGSGQIDFPNDPSCDSAADNEEARPPQCRDGVDNDRDGLVDLADPGCQGNPDYFSEFNVEFCRDGMDNDLDGRIDYPNDPGCIGPVDPDETDPDPLPACADGMDNDGDGLTDYPADVDSCLFAADATEDDPCTRRMATEITGLADARGTTAELPNDFEASCQRLTGPEELLQWRVAADRPLVGLSLSTRSSDFDTVLSVRTRCGGGEVACDDDGAPLGTSFLQLGPQAPGTTLWILLDGGYPTASGIWRLHAVAELAEGANCAGVGRGAFVCGPGLACRDVGGAQQCAPAACANGRDDDRDGIIDYPDEPGCESASDDDERDPADLPVCANRVDDDEDGVIDFPDDNGCAFAADAFEGPDCRDGIDNDGDGTLDYDRDGDGFRDRNGDVGCACNDDPSEAQEPQCGDGCDNDRDGLIDLADPGCNNDPNRDSEFNVAQCRDGIDNNGDGRADFPLDPGCTSRNDSLEETRNPLPACANGIDDDADGAIDFQPNGGGDGGCTSAADEDERSACESDLPDFPDNGEARGNTSNVSDDHDGTCRPGDAPDVTFIARVPYPARVRITSEGSDFDTVVYVRSTCTPVTVCPPPPPPPPAPDGGVADGGVEDAGVVDAGPPPPVCVPMDSELACEDDVVGFLGVVELDWAGGDLYAFLDGFGSATGNYRFAVEAVYPRGGQCGPEQVGYTRCPAGFACRPDAVRGIATCQAN